MPASCTDSASRRPSEPAGFVSVACRSSAAAIALSSFGATAAIARLSAPMIRSGGATVAPAVVVASGAVDVVGSMGEGS